jgi:hypothetical protein
VSLILLASIYALSIFGYGVKGFYCCGKLKSIDVSFDQRNEKEHTSGNDASNCCKTKYQFFKVKDNHVASDNFNNPINFFNAPKLFYSSNQNVFFVVRKNIITNHGNAPPLHNGIPIYISDRTFLI